MGKTTVPLQPGELCSVQLRLFCFKKIFGTKRSLFVVFLLHVGSDLRILIHRLEVSIDQFVGLEDGLGNTVQRSSIEPTHESPDGQVSDGHLVPNIES